MDILRACAATLCSLLLAAAATYYVWRGWLSYENYAFVMSLGVTALVFVAGKV